MLKVMDFKGALGASGIYTVFPLLTCLFTHLSDCFSLCSPSWKPPGVPSWLSALKWLREYVHILPLIASTHMRTSVWNTLPSYLLPEETRSCSHLRPPPPTCTRSPRYRPRHSSSFPAPELSLPWTGSKTTSMLQVSLLKKSHTKHWDLSVPIDMALKVKLLENMV